jgi:hypothetical protein
MIMDMEVITSVIMVVIMEDIMASVHFPFTVLSATRPITV